MRWQNPESRNMGITKNKHKTPYKKQKQQAVIKYFIERHNDRFGVNLLGRPLPANLPIRGKQRAHLGQARYPSWASTLPHLGMVAARMLPICSRYGKNPFGA